MDGLLHLDPVEEEVEQLLHYRPAAHPSRGAASERSSFETTGSGDNQGISSISSPGAAAACIYASHALARWAWRMWEFAVVLILMKLHPTSLLLVSTYGLLDNLTQLSFGPFVGTYIDRTARLRGAIVCYGVQNVCIAMSAVSAGLLVWLKGQHHKQLAQEVYWLLLSTTVAAGASSSVGSLGAAVSVEREYPKVLCGSDTAALARVNSVMRAIDLSAQMLAPVAAGFLMTYGGLLAAIAVMAVYCMAVWPLEVLLLYAAHRRSHVLRQPKHAQLTAPTKSHPLIILLGCHGWGVYFKQSTLLAAVALALLYFTVLSLGFLMTSYLAWRGLPESTLSLFRAAGALSGLSATLLFHPLQRCLGLSLTGFSGIAWQLVCLLIGVVPVIISHTATTPAAAINTQPGRQLSTAHGGIATGVQSCLRSARGLAAVAGGISRSSDSSSADQGMAPLAVAAAAAAGGGGDSPSLLYMLLCGLVASRMGLWLFDLAVMQLQQLYVPSDQLGTVSAVQVSIQSFFEICSFIAGCTANKPEQFHWLMFGSCCTVAAATALYVVFMCGGHVPSSGVSASGSVQRVHHGAVGVPGVEPLLVHSSTERTSVCDDQEQ